MKPGQTMLQFTIISKLINYGNYLHVFKKTPLLNVWHHNLLVNSKEKHVIDHSEVPDSSDDVISLVKDGIATLNDEWVIRWE